jgi:hypothetical protein
VIRALHTFLYLTKFTFKLNGNEEDEVFDALQFYLSQTNVLQHLELRAECVLYKYETTCLMSGLAVNTSVVELTLSCCAFNEDARQCLEAQFRHCNIQKLTMASDSDFDRVVSIGETIGRMLIGSPLQALCVDLWNNFEPWDFAGFCNVLAANAQFIKLKRLHVTDMERVCRRAFLDCLPALVTLQDVEFDVEFEGCSTVKPWSMRSDKMEVCTI